jgi:hypothetical protein
MTDRERARLIGLLREAADQLARDAYKLPNSSETPKGSRDDRRDHDRHPPRVL